MICYTTCMASDVVVSLMWEKCVSTERNKFVGVDLGAYRFETLRRKPVLSDIGTRAC
jgi:hypothetical protein